MMVCFWGRGSYMMVCSLGDSYMMLCFWRDVLLHDVMFFREGGLLHDVMFFGGGLLHVLFLALI